MFFRAISRAALMEGIAPRARFSLEERFCEDHPQKASERKRRQKDHKTNDKSFGDFLHKFKAVFKKALRG